MTLEGTTYCYSRLPIAATCYSQTLREIKVAGEQHLKSSSPLLFGLSLSRAKGLY